MINTIVSLLATISLLFHVDVVADVTATGAGPKATSSYGLVLPICAVSYIAPSLTLIFRAKTVRSNASRLPFLAMAAASSTLLATVPSQHWWSPSSNLALLKVALSQTQMVRYELMPTHCIMTDI